MLARRDKRHADFLALIDRLLARRLRDAWFVRCVGVAEPSWSGLSGRVCALAVTPAVPASLLRVAPEGVPVLSGLGEPERALSWP